MSIQAQTFPVFQPAMRIITAITNDFPAVVTTSFAHQYNTGLIVRLLLPPGFGMFQVNQMSGAITVIDATSFSIDIDTRNFWVFAVPMGVNQYAQCIPIGEINSTVYLATKNVLPYRAV
jgi:hypothetical protein